MKNWVAEGIASDVNDFKLYIWFIQIDVSYIEWSTFCYFQEDMITRGWTLDFFREPPSHSWMGHYFFSYLLTWEVDLIEILEIMHQMWQYVIFLSLKPTKVTSDFILNYLKKVVGGATTQIYQNRMLKPWYFLYGSTPRGPRGVKRCARIH